MASIVLCHTADDQTLTNLYENMANFHYYTSDVKSIYKIQQEEKKTTT